MGFNSRQASAAALPASVRIRPHGERRFSEERFSDHAGIGSKQHVSVDLGVSHCMGKTRSLIGDMAVVKHPAPYGRIDAPRPELFGHCTAADSALYFENSVFKRNHNRTVHRCRCGTSLTIHNLKLDSNPVPCRDTFHKGTHGGEDLIKIIVRQNP